MKVGSSPVEEARGLGGLFVEACECLANPWEHAVPSRHLERSVLEPGTFSIFDVSGR